MTSRVQSRLDIPQIAISGSTVGIVALAAGSLALSLWLIATYPIVYWYDSTVRLAFPDQVLVGRWLPVLQAVIVVVFSVTGSLFALRAVLAVISAGVVVALYGLTAEMFSPAIGLIAAAFLASNVMFVALATVPYQEVLFVFWVLMGLHLLQAEDQEASRNRYLAAGCINLACLTRYEGWLVVGILAAERGMRRLRRAQWQGAIMDSARTGLVFGIAPLIWLLWGTTEVYSHETAVITYFDWTYLYQFFAEYVSFLLWQGRREVVLLGVVGTVWVLGTREWTVTQRRLWAFILLDLVLLVLLDPFSPGNLRQSFLVYVCLLPFAAVGLERLVSNAASVLHSWLDVTRANLVRRIALAAITIAIAGVSVTGAVRFVRIAAHEADFHTPYVVGEWMKTAVPPEARVLTLTDNQIQPYALSVYAGLPLDSIVSATDLTFEDSEAVHGELRDRNVSHVATLYADAQNMSQRALTVERLLEREEIPADERSLGSARVWILSDR